MRFLFVSREITQLPLRAIWKAAKEPAKVEKGAFGEEAAPFPHPLENPSSGVVAGRGGEAVRSNLHLNETKRVNIHR